MPPSTLTPALSSLPATVPYGWMLAALALGVGSVTLLTAPLPLHPALRGGAGLSALVLGLTCLSQALSRLPAGGAQILGFGLGGGLLTVLIGLLLAALPTPPLPLPLPLPLKDPAR
ncbi:QacE family quaternary ammonium compound efflux SMR transporter [Novispirillum itersonii]|uniref:Uncharacterized protein n=1 Tax=Novispirillum itersonii TaxID=189 RepID=A0A7W9ZHF3_NOVIT|nr:QacE family quaternary ammonium compound efflux SMR transporter [Novispirillum itersonii]MBB6211536.1 hypothetical protein [Novispirillum itersonii]